MSQSVNESTDNTLSKVSKDETEKEVLSCDRSLDLFLINNKHFNNTSDKRLRIQITYKNRFVSAFGQTVDYFPIHLLIILSDIVLYYKIFGDELVKQ